MDIVITIYVVIVSGCDTKAGVRMLWLLIGLFLGGFIGMMFVSLVIVGADADRRENEGEML